MEALKARKRRLGAEYDPLVHLLDCCAVNDTVGVCLLLPSWDGCSLAERSLESPYLNPGDSPLSVAQRFNAHKVVLVLNRYQESGELEEPAQRETPLRITKHAMGRESTRPRGRMRRASFALFTQKTRERRNSHSNKEANMLLTVVLGGRHLVVAVFPSTKARHAVFSIGEQYDLDLEAYGLKCNGRWIEDYQSLASQGVDESSELTLRIKHRALLKQREQRQRVRFDIQGFRHSSCIVTYDQYIEISAILEHIKKRYLGEAHVGQLGFYVYLKKTHQRFYLKSCRTLVSYAVYDLNTDVYCYDVSAEQKTPIKLPTSLAAIAKGVIQVKRADIWLSLMGIKEVPSDSLEIYQSESWYDDPVIAKIRSRILLDVDRTLPYHPLFREKFSKGQRRLEKVLVCYAKRDRVVGYCQGMGFIAAVLLSMMSTNEAFAALVVLMDRYGLAQSFGHQMPRLHKLFDRYSSILDSRFPVVAKALAENFIYPATFLTEAFHTLFVCSAPLPVAIRLWDYYLLLGTPFLLQIAIAIVILNRKAILENPEDAAQLLKGALKHVDVNVLIQTALTVKKDQFFVSI